MLLPQYTAVLKGPYSKSRDFNITLEKQYITDYWVLALSITNGITYYITFANNNNDTNYHYYYHT